MNLKQNSQRSSGGKLRTLFCLALSAVLAAGVALNSTAAGAKPVQYDISVVSSSTHTAALSEGSLYVWGTNENSQFPNSDLSYSAEPVQAAKSIADVAVSSDRTLTVSTSGILRSYGIEPATGLAASSAGTLVAADAAQVEANELFAAYIDKNGALYTWGKNDDSYRLGTGSTKNETKPVKIMDGNVAKTVLGDSFGLALTTDGAVYAWGNVIYLSPDFDENDENGAFAIDQPIKIADGVKDIAAGNYHGCMLKNNGELYTFGDNTCAQSGAGNVIFSMPAKILSNIRAVSAGAYHNFAIAEDGTVYTWGYGLSGQLGDGKAICYSTPVKTSFDFVQVFACSENTFGVNEDGDVYSFGNNTNYRLCKANGSDSLTPVRVLDQKMNWVYVEESEENGDEGDDVSNLPAGTAPETVATPFVGGYDDGTFKPENNVTRAEFLRMLVSALCEEYNPNTDYGTCSYSDISLGKWYENYVAYAEQKGLINGFPDGTFRPDNQITRAEASTLTANFLGLDTTFAAPSEFNDVDGTSSEWASAAINALYAKNVIHGYSDGSFRPGKNITRAEAATLIAQATGFNPTDEEKAEILKNFPTSPFTDVPTSKWYYPVVIRAVGYVK